MEYHTFPPHPDIEALVNCYWSLEIPARPQPERQRILADGTLEMVFILGDDIKRYTSEEEFILQPRAMVLGHTLEPFYVEPTGRVQSFAVRFYPYGFINLIPATLGELANKETPLAYLIGKETAEALETQIIAAADTQERIAIIERFLMDKLQSADTVDQIVSSTVTSLLQTQGATAIAEILKENGISRRQLERKFAANIGLSPKQMAKLIRLQAALKLVLNEDDTKLTQIAYDSAYYDQAHFIKDFKEFTGLNPKAFLGHASMELSSVFYK
ncbi:AraC family transcriptional regulator [Sediminicola luteus]|uniref:AraC family transcriptional regulator n=1 Tax=Sediminicola luteus TaxID=319238 RepID=A0A2A4G6L7_9FLAO|nr:helix-turn-helix domain-containing protein [Sediminicola luteus]PCE64073.1 AraC family transcriptional regulator [Sediminicola luteus]